MVLISLKSCFAVGFIELASFCIWNKTQQALWFSKASQSKCQTKFRASIPIWWQCCSHYRSLCTISSVKTGSTLNLFSYLRLLKMLAVFAYLSSPSKHVHSTYSTSHASSLSAGLSRTCLDAQIDVMGCFACQSACMFHMCIGLSW